MIPTAAFLEPARARGFDWYAGVPCSFLTPFIDGVIAEDGVAYVASANEGDAVAAGAGALLGGRRAVVMMQNSGLGNAVNPLTSLAWPFRFPLLLVVTWRGDPRATDEPQHRLMGRITGRMLEAMEIPWEVFPSRPEAVGPALDRAEAHFRGEGRPYALVMRKGTVEPERRAGARRGGARPPPGRPRPAGPENALAADAGEAGGPGGAPALAVRRYRRTDAAARPSRGEALRRIVELTPERGGAAPAVLIAATGHTGRELHAVADRPNQLYMVGSMGCASSLGLGLAMARPDLRVVVVDGDGALLMRLGNLSTVGAYGGPNLVHVVLDNEMHASTGGQATVSAGVSFADAAVACGYGSAWEGDGLQLLDEALAPAGRRDAPSLVHLKIRPGSPGGLPRPDLSPEAVKERLVRLIEAPPPAGDPGSAVPRPWAASR